MGMPATDTPGLTDGCSGLSGSPKGVHVLTPEPVSVTSFGKRVFADGIQGSQDELIPDNLVAPKSSDSCPSERHRGGTVRGPQGGSPLPRSLQEPGSEEARRDSAPEPPEGAQSHRHLSTGLWPPEL